MAPATSASSTRNGSMTTPAELSSGRSRRASMPASTSLPTTSAELSGATVGGQPAPHPRLRLWRELLRKAPRSR
jgi:hypothetical protein